MIQLAVTNGFQHWRELARALLQNNIAPDEVLWTNDAQNGLFTDAAEITNKTNKTFKVPADFLELVETAACADNPDKWTLLYRLLWRVIFENRNLLEIESDEDVRAALLHAKAVRRDVHKMKAFVRFRRVANENGETFVAWHEPAHFIVERTAPFFVRRFGAMRFSILTPKGCADWDLENLIFSPGVAADQKPQADEFEDFWRAYYASVFNPARLKIKAMKSEMPKRFWRNLPEAELIPDLIRQAENRTREMLKNKASRAAVIKKLSETAPEDQR